jgi:hypothetical protein
MLRSLAILSAFSLGLTATGALAADDARTWEVRAGVGSGLGGVGMGGGVEIQSGGGDTNTIASLEAGIGYILPSTPMLEIGLFPGIFSISGDSDLTLLKLMAGPILNFMPDRVEDSVYALALVGLYSLSSGPVSQSNFAFAVGLGKRFQLFPHVSYSPELQFQDVTSSPSLTTFRITPVQFSFLF